MSLLHSLICLALSNISLFFHQSLAFEKCRVMEEIVVMDLAASAAMAVEDNLPKPLMLSGNFHYVCALLSMVEINVFFPPINYPRESTTVIWKHKQ